MTGEEILSEVARLAREKLDYHGPVRSELHLVEDLELDSLRLLTLAVEVENTFRIRLDQEDEEAIETVADLVAVIRRNSGRQSAHGERGPES